MVNDCKISSTHTGDVPLIAASQVVKIFLLWRAATKNIKKALLAGRA